MLIVQFPIYDVDDLRIVRQMRYQAALRILDALDKASNGNMLRWMQSRKHFRKFVELAGIAGITRPTRGRVTMTDEAEQGNIELWTEEDDQLREQTERFTGWIADITGSYQKPLRTLAERMAKSMMQQQVAGVEDPSLATMVFAYGPRLTPMQMEAIGRIAPDVDVDTAEPVVLGLCGELGECGENPDFTGEVLPFLVSNFGVEAILIAGTGPMVEVDDGKEIGEKHGLLITIIDREAVTTWCAGIRLFEDDDTYRMETTTWIRGDEISPDSSPLVFEFLDRCQDVLREVGS